MFRAVRAVVVSCALCIGLFACGGDEPPLAKHACEPLAMFTCTCPGGAPSLQQCSADGTRLGACACGGGSGVGGAGVSGVAGAAGFAGGSGSGGFVDGGVTLPDGAVIVDDGPGTIVAAPVDDAAFLWDDTLLRTFELTLAQTDLDAINANPAAEQYVPASFTLGAETVANASVRYKGSVGAFIGCTAGVNAFDPSGPKTCPKLSMKVAFDQVDPAGRFHGLKKLNFHSMNDDDSLMRDRLGYALFREMGLAAPRAVHARLLINGQLAGLFALVEEVDGRFADSRFTARGDGNLYKEIWPKWTDPNAYRMALETNRDNPNVSFDRVIRFATALGAATDDVAVNALAEQWMDMKYVMDFIAVDRTILNDDGMFHWYCNTQIATGANPGACSNHNYFVYEEDHWDRLWLVEWDVTLAFRGEATGFTTIVDSWDATNVSCTPKPGATPISPQQLPPSCDALTHAWGARQTEYKAAVRRFLDGPYSAANVDGKLAAWTSQISAAVSEAAALGHQPSAAGWQQQLSSLRATIADLRAAAAARAP